MKSLKHTKSATSAFKFNRNVEHLGLMFDTTTATYTTGTTSPALSQIPTCTCPTGLK